MDIKINEKQKLLILMTNKRNEEKIKLLKLMLRKVMEKT